MTTKDIRYGLGQIVSSDGILTWLGYPVFLDLLAAVTQWSCRESNPSFYQALCVLNCGFVTSRSRSFPFIPARYPRIRFRVLTASRAPLQFNRIPELLVIRPDRPA
jgi:hypothetical protein